MLSLRQIPLRMSSCVGKWYIFHPLYKTSEKSWLFRKLGHLFATVQGFGKVSRDFLFLVFFHESVSPQPQSIPLRPFRIFSKIRGDIRKSRCSTGINRQRHRWQIFPPVSLVLLIPVANLPPVNLTGGKHWEQLSNCWKLKMNLKKKIYLYANCTTQKCPKETIKFFWLKIFSICHWWCTLSCECLREFSKKFETALLV